MKSPLNLGFSGLGLTPLIVLAFKKNPYQDKIDLGYDIYHFWTKGKFDIEKYVTLDGVRP